MRMVPLWVVPGAGAAPRDAADVDPPSGEEAAVGHDDPGGALRVRAQGQGVAELDAAVALLVVEAEVWHGVRFVAVHEVGGGDEQRP